MAGIPRKAQLIFGGALSPPGNIAVIGSLAAGARAFSGDLAVLQSLSQYGFAWQGTEVGSNSPALEDMTALFYLLTTQVAYMLARGVPEWDVATQYNTSDIARVGSQLYRSKIDANTGNNPVTDMNNWELQSNATKGPTACAASVVFDGINATAGNARIISSFNVSTVTKNAAGSYTVNFAANLPSANYALGGSCGSEDGNAYGAGDNGVIVGNVTGQGNAVRSAAACRIFTINPSSLALVESGCVSLFFFSQ